ncbi:pyridoxal phosphate-dependent decarboxylase family protein [Nannocystis punicea]|uniref:Aminotransferase class V-fold PLP-dependent enzyme n=1 Tax=Nannocystis punicea TaxID=2995304 RepID=A0ABY7GV24_9BACT|nr:aminotransferase class V-fold PLP-dependent enzyme [Nannocystis poenicansa]WAS90798.1 aminotransferase class V-fold PLP-dependent enzyme [Nannocystis poenicansa]
MTPDQFRRLGHRLVEWIADYREQCDKFPVRAVVEPGAVRAGLPPHPPEAAEDLEAALFADLERIIVPGLTHWQHPSFFAWFPGNANLASVLAELLAAGLGQNGINWQASPALTEVEEVTCDWMRQLLGLSTAWSGVIQDVASTATLVALLCARERATAYSQTRGGLQAEPAPLVVYATSEAHSSIEKAALLAGFGRLHLRTVATDDALAMRPDALAAMIADDRKAGLRPCAVVATIGSTATTAIDPLAAIVPIARAHGLWVHVDAAMAGTAMLLPECRPLWDGVEGADSIVLNPHKWLGVVGDCSLYYVRDPAHLVRVMSTNPSYLRTDADPDVHNFRDWGIPLGRRFRALKLWLHLRASGAEALRARLRRDLEHARWLAAEIDDTPHWRRIAPVRLQTVCVRHEPPGLSAEATDAHNLAWVEQLNQSGAALLTPAQVRGEWIVRISIGAEATEFRHVEALWQQMRALAESCVASPSSR